MRESKYEADLVKHIRQTYPGCVILKNDANRIQGIPDRLILHGRKWAMLEVKRASTEPFQPNQEYYLDLLHEMSFASVIHPQNEEEVLGQLQIALDPRR